MTDSELVRAAQAHDAEAWRTLYQRYLPSVWRYAYLLTSDRHQAEDVVAEAMLALLKGIHQIDGETPGVSAWLRAVVRHKVFDHHRENSWREDRRPSFDQNRKQDTKPSLPLERAEQRIQILEIMDSLPERQRMALEWKYVEDLQVREIALRLGETERAVESILYRGRREFRRKYEQAEIQPTYQFSKRDLAEKATDLPLPPQ